jgi:uncharacterized protein (DUF58 family)
MTAVPRAWRSNWRPTAELPIEAAVASKKRRGCQYAAPTRRGWLDLPRVRLATRYPLGLFTAWAYLQPAMRCLVYPRQSPPPAGRQCGGKRRHTARWHGGQEDFAGFRPRQPADSPRHVAWKASARDSGEGPLLIKQFAGGAEVELISTGSTPTRRCPVDTRLGILTGWVLAAEAAGDRYGLACPASKWRRPAATHRQRCLEALALFQP